MRPLPTRTPQDVAQKAGLGGRGRGGRWRFMRRDAGRRGEDGGPPQLLAVAVDAGKSSQHALKWAADHLIPRGQIFFLVHVRRKISSIPTPTGNQVPISEVEKDVASTFLEQIDYQTKELLLPFQCFCSKRGLQCKEVILDATDVQKAIVDFIMKQFVDKLVLGASSRTALSKTFRSDVPTLVSKAAPDFCSVFVISKGKISSIRPAIHPNKHPVRQSLQFEISGNQFQSSKSEPFVGHHMGFSGSGPVRGFRLPGVYNDGMSDNNSKSDLAETYLDYSYQSTASCPSPSRSIIDRPGNYYFQDYLDSPHQSHLSQQQVGNTYPSEQMRGLGLNRDGTTSSSGGSNSSGFEPSSAFPQEHGRISWSNKSMTHAWMPNEKVRMEAAQLAEQAAIELAEKERERHEVLLEAAQAAQRQKIMGIEEKKMSGDRKLLQEMIQKIKVLDGSSTDVRYRKYTIEDIQEATRNFSDELKIGEGGYGPVFKASLDHTAVAIKILRPDAAQGEKQFQQEIEVLSCIRHPNMVLLMGACPEYGCLVYEYMANGSLEDRLFCRSNTTPLSWQLRFKIAAEIATALLFLHQTKPEPLVHRDLKPGNILLDHNFVSKIADVGLARLVPPSVADAVTQYHMTAAAGTFCYIDPEYQQTGMLGTKSDIYAFGVILLQLVTAAQPMGLAHNIEKALEEGKFERMLDPNVPDWPMEETLNFAKLALKCVELQKKDRPDLVTVVLPKLNRLREVAERTPINSRIHHH